MRESAISSEFRAEFKEVFFKELRSLARQPRGLLITIFLLTFSAFSIRLPPNYLSELQMSQSSSGKAAVRSEKGRVAIIGDDKLIRTSLADEFKIVSTSGTAAEMLKKQDADVVVVIPADFSKNLLSSSLKIKSTTAAEVPTVTVMTDAGRLDMNLNDQIRESLTKVRKEYQRRYLEALGLQDPWADISFKYENLATPSERAGNDFVFKLTTFLLFIASFFVFGLSGSMVVDESDSGTFDVILVCPVSRSSIVAGKIFASIILGSVMTTWGVVSLAFAFGWNAGTAITKDAQLFTPSWTSLCSAVAFGLCVVPVFATAGVAAGVRCRTDATVMMLSCVVLVIVELLAGVLWLPPRLISPIISIVPVSNVAICLRDACSGKYNAMWILSTVSSSIVYSSIAAVTATKWLSQAAR